MKNNPWLWGSGIGLMVIAIVAFAFSYNNRPSKINSHLENNPETTHEVSLEEKVGQMLLLGFRGTEVADNSSIGKSIQDLHLGGVILFDYDVPSNSFPRNIISPSQTKKLISDLQSFAETPLFISVDAEGGNVNRLQPKYGFKSISSAETMGKDTTLKTVNAESERLAEELNNLGFNMNFAPVLDVNVNPKNPVIGALGRSFSADPNTVIDNARVFINNQTKNNIISVEKHFPGHGSSTSDSHLGLVDVTKTYQEKELNPYIELQKENLLDVVMTAHIINQNVDKDYPATLSPKFIQDILRKQIRFDGVVISDDMQMDAIARYYGFEDAIIRAINAGCDILLLSNNGKATYDPQLAEKAKNAIITAVREGKISEERINQSYQRIINLKKKFQIID